MPELVLTGCTPEPLMNYLKALGVFRLVAEQADPGAKLSWREGAVCLHSSLDRQGLIEFFLTKYRPTPIVGPWGARSGFYPGSSESSAREALNRIVAGAEEQPTLAPFGEVITVIRRILETHGFTEKVRDEDKLELMRLCRNELPDKVLPWLDAVFILTDESRKFPPLLGTGGNEGSGSYVSSFAQVIVSLLIEHEFDAGVANALFREFVPTIGGVAVGHFDPGAIGGANSSQGFHGGGGVNRWDYLLAMEGCLMFAGAAARRIGVDTAGRAAFPFCVEAVAVGYASESDKEAGGATRAELWLPLWVTAVSYAELSQLFSEGRAQLGRRQARNAVEFAVAVNLLGVGRGVNSFTRYAFVMRNGLSFFAASLGKVAVVARPSARLLDDPPFIAWLDRFRSACRDKEKTPARYQVALHQIDAAIFAFANRSESSGSADRRAMLDVLRALGRAEQALATGLAFCKDKYLRPLQGLSPQWLEHANDGSTEFRVAASLAGIRGRGAVGPMRAYLEQVETRGATADWSPGSTSAVWSRRPLEANLAAVFIRRLLEAFRDMEAWGQVGVPQYSPRPAPLSNVTEFLAGQLDLEKLNELLWGMLGLEWPKDWVMPERIEGEIPFEFGVLRLLLHPKSFAGKAGKWTVAEDMEPNTKPDPDVFHILASGRSEAIRQCVNRAAQRLKSGGLLVKGFRNGQRDRKALDVQSAIPAARLLAAMLIPLSDLELQVIANSVLYPPEYEE